MKITSVKLEVGATLQRPKHLKRRGRGKSSFKPSSVAEIREDLSFEVLGDSLLERAKSEALLGLEDDLAKQQRIAEERNGEVEF